MSFTRSTPPPYNSLSQGLGTHGRNPSWTSNNIRSGWAASFANSAKSPRGTGAQLDPASGARSPPAGSAHSSRAASFSGNVNRLTSPTASRFSRRVSSPRVIPPLVIPPMRRRGGKGPMSNDGTVQVRYSIKPQPTAWAYFDCRQMMRLALKTRSLQDQVRCIAPVVWPLQ
jgi:hypothetical protein